MMSAVNDSNTMLSMSLDDIITNTKKSRRGASNRGTRGRGGAIRNNQQPRGDRNKPYQAARKLPISSSSLNSVTEGKLLVENLGFHITQNEIKELFSEIGQVRSVQLNFDSHGKSKGSATVIFHKSGDSIKAHKELNNRTLDGKPMRIELIMSSKALPSILNGSRSIHDKTGTRGVSTRGGRGGLQRGAGRGAGRGGRRGGKKEPKTQAELDSEMDTYMNDTTMTDA